MCNFEATISLFYGEIKLFNRIFKHWCTPTLGMNTRRYWVDVCIHVTSLTSTGECGWKSRIVSYYFYSTMWIVFRCFEELCTCFEYSHSTSVKMKIWLVPVSFLPEVWALNPMYAKKELNRCLKLFDLYWFRAVFWSQKLLLNNLTNQCD